MLVKTKWFGEVEVEEGKIITFEKGLMGLEDKKKYALIYNTEKTEERTIMWLQSLEDELFALPVVDPTLIMSTYDPIVEEDFLDSLGDLQTSELLILVTLTIPPDLTKMTTNLKAPIIINADNLKACQTIVNNEEYLVKYPIYEIIKNSGKKDGE